MAAVAPSETSWTCPAPPAFAKVLAASPYYIDKHASVIDPKKLAAFQAATEAPTRLGQLAGLAADAYLAKGSRDAARCVYSLLDAAAQAEAWTGRMPGFSGVYMQNWELSGVAIPYLKVRRSGAGTPEQDARIQRWLHLLAGRVMEYFDAHMTQPGSDAWNNHMYWAGLAVASEGIADDDASAFEWGMRAYRRGVDAIQPDGSLAAEMNRRQMALHYHLYAVGPLILLAEFGEVNGFDCYAEDKGAIHLLVKFCVKGLKDPGLLEKRTGVRQVIPDPLAGLDIGWAVPYVRRFPDPEVSSLLARAAWTRFWQWGGAPPE